MGPLQFTGGENLAIALLQPVGAVSTPPKARDVLFLDTSLSSVGDSAPQPHYRVYFIGPLLTTIVGVGFEETDSEPDIGL